MEPNTWDIRDDLSPVYSYWQYAIEVYKLKDGAFLVFRDGFVTACYPDGIAWLSEYYGYYAKRTHHTNMLPSLEKFAHEHFTEAEWVLAALTVL